MRKSGFPVLFLFIAFAGCQSGARPTVEFRLIAPSPGPDYSIMTMKDSGEAFYVHNETLLSQSDIDSAAVILSSGYPLIEFVFTPDGKRRLERVTTENVGKRFAMVIDGELVSAPLVQTPIAEGRLVIAGRYTLEEAHQIALGINRSR
jgi:SecD/SecF fusion protein